MEANVSVPFKPRNSEARHFLKYLKDGFDNPALEVSDKLVEWVVLHGPAKAMRAYAGEFLHQLALRYERRGDIESALRLYALSAKQLSGNPLGLARTLRDHGMCIVLSGNTPSEGVALIEQAVRLHEDDIDNQKGRRQQWITASKLWRAHIIINNESAKEAKKQLLALALHPHFGSYYVRDRRVIIDFLVTRTKGKTRRQLLAMKAAIHAERRQPVHVAGSYVRLIVDIELSIANTLVRRVFRRE